MAANVNAPRGMRDFLPADKAKREELLRSVRSTYLQRGFQEIETPILEDLDRLTSGQGGDNEKLVFKVQKRGQEFESARENGEELADMGMRFDLTVPLTRFYATNHSKLPRVFKAIQTGPVFRAERPQKGRYRQFVQCDIDIIGDSSVLAEVELLSASLAALERIGLDGMSIRVNHRALLAQNISELGITDQDALSAMISIDKLDKIAIEGVAKELEEKFGKAVADRATKWLSNIESVSVPELLKPIWDGLGAKATKLKFDPTLVRGMGYYTGTIFEIEHPASSGSIGGGGRYDGMVGKWLGTDVPAVGISLGVERIVDLISQPQTKNPSIVLIVESGNEASALSLQSELLAQGKTVRIEIKPKNLSQLLDSMRENGFDSFAIVRHDSQKISELEIKALA